MTFSLPHTPSFFIPTILLSSLLKTVSTNLECNFLDNGLTHSLIAQGAQGRPREA